MSQIGQSSHLTLALSGGPSTIQSIRRLIGRPLKGEVRWRVHLSPSLLL